MRRFSLDNGASGGDKSQTQACVNLGGKPWQSVAKMHRGGEHDVKKMGQNGC